MTTQRPAVAMKVQHRLGAVLDAIHEDPRQVPLQSQAAATAGMSPASFSRFFRRQLGKPYNAYVIDVRIARACRKLAETDASIIEIAFDVGFNNLSNFNRQFLSTRGMTPSAYRRLQMPL